MAVGVVLGQVGAVQTVNNQVPDPSGNINITAENVNAIPDQEGAVTSSYLANSSVTKDKIKSGAVSTNFSLQIPTTTLWKTDSLGLYTDLNLSGILSSDRPIVDINLSNVTSQKAQELMEEYGKIYSVNAISPNTVRFRATEKLTKEINVQLMCVRK